MEYERPFGFGAQTIIAMEMVQQLLLYSGPTKTTYNYIYRAEEEGLFLLPEAKTIWIRGPWEVPSKAEKTWLNV